MIYRLMMQRIDRNGFWWDCPDTDLPDEESLLQHIWFAMTGGDFSRRAYGCVLQDENTPLYYLAWNDRDQLFTKRYMRAGGEVVEGAFEMMAHDPLPEAWGRLKLSADEAAEALRRFAILLYRKPSRRERLVALIARHTNRFRIHLTRR